MCVKTKQQLQYSIKELHVGPAVFTHPQRRRRTPASERCIDTLEHIQHLHPPKKATGVESLTFTFGEAPVLLWLTVAYVKWGSVSS